MRHSGQRALAIARVRVLRRRAVLADQREATGVPKPQSAGGAGAGSSRARKEPEPGERALNKYRQGLSAFVQPLLAARVISHNPMAGIVRMSARAASVELETDRRSQGLPEFATGHELMDAPRG